MSWNNRIIRKVSKHPIFNGKMQVWYDIHEVYYAKNGKPNGWTKDPIIGGFDSRQDAILSLSDMLRDIIRFPPLKQKGNKLMEERAYGVEL